MVAEADYNLFKPPFHSGLNWITDLPDAPRLPITTVQPISVEAIEDASQK
jgi:hypothetical protein